jgi:hypothetical protein
MYSKKEDVNKEKKDNCFLTSKLSTLLSSTVDRLVPESSLDVRKGIKNTRNARAIRKRIVRPSR